MLGRRDRAVSSDVRSERTAGSKHIGPRGRKEKKKMTTQASKSRRETAGQERLPAAVRQARISKAFDSKGYVGVSSLADELGVSTMTIRRDISVLEERGVLKRTHGGAVSAEMLDAGEMHVPEPPFSERVESHAAEKRAIAAAAAAMVQPGEAIALDVGTSTLLLAQALSRRSDLRVMTNNLSAASAMAPSGSPVYLLGGQVRWPELSIIGAEAVAGAESRYTDRAFLGISGLDASGCYDYSPEDTLVKRAYIANTGSVVLLCDSSKFGSRAMVKVVDLPAVDAVVTDAAPPEDIASALRAADIDVIVADVGGRS